MLISYLFNNPLVFVLIAVALIISITIHEFSHALASHLLGDSTAKSMGRLSLNPKAHLDPMGTLLLLFAGIGWGKPVPFNPLNLRNPRRDSAIIAFSGPLSNFVLAILISLTLRVFGSGGMVAGFLHLVVFYNLILCFFNLIPINPLDGFKVVAGLLPQELFYQWMQFAPYGSYILLFLVLTRTIGKILDPIVGFFLRIFGLPGPF
ncbi:MAG: site-2 protease family protein [Patescibacteria group bacterium]